MLILFKAIYRSIPIKNPMEFFIQIEKNPKIYIENQKTLNNHNNLEKEQSWKHHPFWFQTVLQSYNNEYSMAQREKQT